MSDPKIIRKILGAATSDKSVVGQAVFEVLRTCASPEDQAEILATALEERDSAAKHTGALPNKGLTSEVWNELNEEHLRFISEFLRHAFLRSSTSKEFAAEILKLVALMDSDDEKTFALSTALFSDYVPYRQLPGLRSRLSDAAFTQLLKAHQDEADLIRYVSKISFTRGTDEASAVLGVLDEVEPKDLRVALLGHYLARVKNQIVEIALKRQAGEGD